MSATATSNGLPRREVLAFLADIRENPEDDAARLILADWLEEQHDPAQAARGEFVRLQCREPRTAPSRARQAELLARHADVWLGPLRKYVEAWVCRRGLLHVGAEGRLLLSDAAAEVPEEAFAWIEGLTLHAMNDDLATRLAEAPWLAGITTLELHGGRIGDRGAQTLANSPHVRSLRTLLLRGHHVGNAGAQALARAPGLGNLVTLSLAYNRIHEDGVRAWAVSPHLAHMRALNVEGNTITPGAHAALRAAAAAHPQLWIHVRPGVDL